MILEAKNLSFRYEEKGRQILNQFSLRADSSERVGIVAPSGLGKTTLCKLLAGYEEPESGEILLDGKQLQSYKGYCPVQMIWQHPEQAVNPRLRMRAVFEEGDQVDPALMEKLGIEPDWLNRFPTELSGGEQQRFCIARALGKRTRFLLADEITAALDAQTAHSVTSDILDLHGMTRIVVTHTLEESLLRRYDSIFVLKDGQIDEAGSVDSLMQKKGYFYALFTLAQ